MTSESRSDGANVVVRGELDLYSVTTLATALGAAETAGPAKITLDLTAVTFIDSSGLRALLLAAQSAERNGHGLEIIASPVVARLARITGTDARLNLGEPTA